MKVYTDIHELLCATVNLLDHDDYDNLGISFNTVQSVALCKSVKEVAEKIDIRERNDLLEFGFTQFFDITKPVTNNYAKNNVIKYYPNLLELLIKNLDKMSDDAIFEWIVFLKPFSSYILNNIEKHRKTIEKLTDMHWERLYWNKHSIFPELSKHFNRNRFFTEKYKTWEEKTSKISEHKMKTIFSLIYDPDGKYHYYLKDNKILYGYECIRGEIINSESYLIYNFILFGKKFQFRKKNRGCTVPIEETNRLLKEIQKVYPKITSASKPKTPEEIS